MTIDQDEALAARRRKLKFRSWHRGMREMDLIMGRFADAFIDAMAPVELDEFERLIETPDPDLMAWIMGAEPPPATSDTPMLRRLRDFQFSFRAGA